MGQQFKPLIIGIAGGTGSGKSTITENVKERFGDDVTVIMHDDYYKAHDSLTYEERSKLNYDYPGAYDTDLMIEHISLLREGRSILSPVYDFSIHNRSKETKEIFPSKIILIEGILILDNPKLCELMDIKVFVDTDADVRIIRRILRDINERGRALDNIVDQYLTTVKPMHELYVEPSRKNADLIVPQGGRNAVAMDLLYQKIQNYIQEMN